VAPISGGLTAAEKPGIIPDSAALAAGRSWTPSLSLHSALHEAEAQTFVLESNMNVLFTTGDLDLRQKELLWLLWLL